MTANGRREVRTQRRRAAACLVALLSGWAIAGGCSDLQSIEPNQCGNGVVELKHGEDCECNASSEDATTKAEFAGTCTFRVSDTETHRCNKPDQPNACRIRCATAEDCPDGWGCGSDAICRVASGTFEQLGAAIAETAFDVRLGDLDGDGNRDILSVGDMSFYVHYLEQGGSVGRTLTVPTEGAGTTVGDVDGDGVDDFTINVGLGLGVELAQRNRTVEPVAFPTFRYGDPGLQDLHVLALDVLPGPAWDPQVGGDEFLAVARTLKGWSLITIIGTDLQPNALSLPVNKGPVAADTRLGGVATGKIGPPSLPCDKIAVGFGGTQFVQVISPCDKKANAVVRTDFSQPLPYLQDVKLNSVLLPGDALAGVKLSSNVFLVDANGDALLDLIAATTKCQDVTCVDIEVAYGFANGTFGDTPPINPGDLFVNGNGKTQVYFKDIGQKPIAVGDIDGDGVLDEVDPFGLAFGALDKDGNHVADRRGYDNTGSAPWTQALIHDFDSNGKADVIVGSRYGSNLTLYINAGNGLFNPAVIPTGDSVDSFAAGDFDGDLIPDLAFAETARDTDDPTKQEQSLAITFGSGKGALEPPVYMGRFHDITEIIAMDQTLSGADAMTDLGTLVPPPSAGQAGQKQEWRFSVSLGSSRRQVQAPLALRSMKDQEAVFRTDVPLASFIGNFGDNASTDLAALGLRLSSNQTALKSDLWLIRLGQDAELTQAPTSTDLPDLAQGTPLTLTDGVVLKGTDHDQLVLSLPVGTPPVGTLFTAKSDGKTWSLGQPWRQQEMAMYTRLAIADIDGDEVDDLVALEATLQQDANNAQDFVVVSRTPVYFPGKGVGIFADQEMVLAQASAFSPCEKLPASSASSIVDLTVANLDEDATREVVVTGSPGTFVIDIERKNNEVKILSPRCVDGAPPGEAIVGGDLTGDGVDDLVIAAKGSTTIRRGVPTR